MTVVVEVETVKMLVFGSSTSNNVGSRGCGRGNDSMMKVAIGAAVVMTVVVVRFGRGGNGGCNISISGGNDGGDGMAVIVEHLYCF